mgnify:FL=1
MIIFNPSTAKKIAIFPYTQNALFFTETGSYIPFLNVDKIKVLTPSFDFLLNTQRPDMETSAADGDNYFFGAANNLNIDGIEYYKPLNTFTYSPFISTPQNNVLKTSGNLSTLCVLPYNEQNSFSKFQESLWRISVYPFIPFFLYTDVSPTNIGGPLFSKNFSISVDSSSAVKIDLSFEGGTSIKTPDPGTIDSYTFPFSDTYTPGIGVTGIGTDNQDILQDQIFSYRAAKIFDCIFGFPTTAFSTGIYTSYAAAPGWRSNQNYVKITEMKLNIIQNLTITYTANDGETKNIINGIKCIAMSERTVEGSIQFIASSDLSYIYSTPNARIQEMVMYFGGPYYYPMKNVSIQPTSSISINPQNGSYIHSIKFIALLQPSPSKETDWFKLNQFDISYEGILRPITGSLYVDEQV